MVLQLHVWAIWLLQEAEGGGISFDPRSVWAAMGIVAKCVVIVLFIMSAWSIGVMIDRLIAYSRGPKAIACVRTGCGGCASRRQTGRGR